ncbi:enterochelin esterase [Methylocystis sp. H4A]|uniref:enterochelin esterase n=1 Tax=Methylocystis sp. H4A TaxID=2785788 RepID=UPI0018C2044C|nr:enterochelin esterase [Methylocystis sp. H4A]MBG0802490.1 enterochelin esterase [Methylocystis sp. H4A]
MTTPCQQLLKGRFGRDVGSDRWWRRVAIEGCPIVQAIGGDRARVLFLWRDPDGDATTSRTRCVYIDICSVTDHHSNEPASLERIAGTDVWHWSFEVEAEWRGSYCFIPLDDNHLHGARGAESEMSPKDWWRAALKFAQTDSLNPNLSHVGLRGQPLSAAHLPQAPLQTAWRDVDRNSRPAADQSRLHRMEWNSARLRNSRRVWIYRTGATPKESKLPLVVLLDGQYWAEAMPVFAALDHATLADLLPPSVYVLIDSLNADMRRRELACDEAFLEAVQRELLPIVAGLAPYGHDPSKTVIAGQSFGGLAALFAGLRSPECFGCVLSQSGSFWWPGGYAREDLRPHVPDTLGDARDVVADLIESSKSGASRLRVFLEAGSFEKIIRVASDRVHRTLIDAGHDAHYRVYSGGHDPLCWRGGLLDGLSFLLADHRAAPAGAPASRSDASRLAITNATE